MIILSRFLFLIYFFVPGAVVGQQNLADSLQVLFENAQGEEKTAILIDLSNATVYNATPAALLYAEEAEQLAINISNDSLRYAALKAKGYANGYLGDFSASLDNMYEGLDYYLYTSDSVKIAEAYSDIAYLLQALSADQDKIMEYNLKALSIREKIGDEKGVAYSLNNIGSLYWKWKKYDQSIGYFLSAIPYFERMNLIEEIATITGNIGAYYTEKQQYEKATSYLAKALKSYRKVDHKHGESLTLTNIGKTYMEQNQLDSAIYYNQRAKEIRTLLGDREGLVANYYNIGLIDMMQGAVSEAEENLFQSAKIAEETGLVHKLIPIYGTLADLYRNSGDFDDAYFYLDKSKVLNDSIFSVEKHQQLEELRTRYDVERKEAENEQLKIENQNQQLLFQRNRVFLYLAISLSLLVMLMMYIVFLRIRNEDQLKALVNEQRLLRSQMNPHFIFNAISAIQNYIMSHSAIEASNYLSKFSVLMRQIIYNSGNDLVDLASELKLLENYFSLQMLRYPGLFEYTIEIDKSFNTENVLIPPMLNQPFIENAIEHGLKNIDYKGKIEICYQLVADDIHIYITDNGVGINQTLKTNQTRNEGHEPFALNNTRNRLKMLYKKRKRSNSVFEVTDQSDITKNATGTVIHFTIPYQTRF
ncbi:MAG: tetratricopeptide repeat protein [Prolixibacteraceae bacterium]|jgi:tetratricopeptide (TPR) repeat protein|nr:tetratricopeptide repeat protein [Prolixibacteraceae bacterium]